MKKLLPLFLVLTLVAGVSGAWAKNSSFGSSFGSSGFKSIQQLNVSPRLSAPGQGYSAPTTVYHSYGWSPPIFFWVPVGGYGPAPEGAGLGWILILIVVGVVVMIFFFRRRVPAMGDPEDEETEELEMFYQRCQKNLDHLANTYVDAQDWLGRLEGKIPASQWKDWNDKFTRISIEDFTRQLKEIRQDLDQGRQVAARAALFSFDEDAVAVFEFLREMENTLEEVG
jgi:hypothetical protein